MVAKARNMEAMQMMMGPCQQALSLESLRQKLQIVAPVKSKANKILPDTSKRATKELL